VRAKLWVSDAMGACDECAATLVVMKHISTTVTCLFEEIEPSSKHRQIDGSIVYLN
jgi:hypothetical protein